MPQAQSEPSEPSEPESAAARLSRKIGLSVFVAVSVVSLAATLAWALFTLRTRPLDGVEGELLFEAMRLREKRALYIDPVVGDLYAGEPATRYWVLYPPLFSWLVSLLPLSSVGAGTVAVRLLSLASWSGAVVVLARRAGSAVRSRERAALVWGGAAFVLGTYVLSLFGAAGRPDALALLLAALGLSRAIVKGKVDALAGVLFALAVFVKPNVLGLATGALLATAVRHRVRQWGGLLAFGLAASAVLVTLHLASGGQFLAHLVASTAQDTSSGLWLSQMASRLPFFLAPVALALALGVRHFKDDHTFVAFAALAASFSWALLSLAKIGSASNYWMEPCLGALALLSRAPSLSLGRGTTFACVLLGVQAPYDGVASVRSSLEGLREGPARRAALEQIRASCNERPGDVTIADEPGTELLLDGRVISTAFQFAHARSPALSAAWEASVSRPEIRCVVVENDLLERVGDDDAVRDRFSPPLKIALRRRFRLEKTEAGFYIYRAR